MKVLIIQQKMIGDVLTSTVLFEVIKDRYPISELHYLINDSTSAVVENNPFIDKVKLLSKGISKDKYKFLKFIKGLHSERYSTIIDTYGKLSSLSICLAVNASKKIGYSKSYTKFIYTHPISRIKTPIHNYSLAIENRLRLLLPLEIDFQPVLPQIFLTDEEKLDASEFLKANNIDLDKPLFMISVLGSSNKKSYPKEYMAELLDTICAKLDCSILFNYIPNQIDEVKKIYNQCRVETKKKIHFNVYAKSLRQFMAITYFCDALIGNEGGATNIAKALGIPTFTIFSPHLNKQNWFGKIEEKKHAAVQLRDYIPMSPQEIKRAKNKPAIWYQKFPHSLFKSELESFLQRLDV